MSLEDWPVALLAGGLATRLWPLTKKMPKALVKVADEPFLAHQLRLLRAQGIRQIILCLGYLGEMIETHFGDGAAYGMNIEYSFDGPQLLGTGGALKRALPALGDRFFVVYGDSYLPTNYAKVAQAFLDCGKPAMMTVFKNRHRWDTSNVEFDGKEILRYDKTNRDKTMQYIDYGLNIFRSEAFANCLGDKPFDLAQFYPDLIIRNQLAGFEVKERFYEIGSSRGLAELDSLLRRSPTPAQS
jgi:NDP-sugar pyrophosphorylase family protein